MSMKNKGINAADMRRLAQAYPDCPAATAARIWSEAVWQTAEIIAAAAALRGDDDFAARTQKLFRTGPLRKLSRMYPPEPTSKRRKAR
jgi:hypothetical protein